MSALLEVFLPAAGSAVLGRSDDVTNNLTVTKTPTSKDKSTPISARRGANESVLKENIENRRREEVDGCDGISDGEGGVKSGPEEGVMHLACKCLLQILHHRGRHAQVNLILEIVLTND